MRSLLSIYVFFVLSISAKPLNWYEYPGRWFKNVFSVPAKDNPAPEIDAEDSAGNRVFLHNVEGEYILLSFWASWCPLCRNELPELDKLSVKFSSRGIKFLAINVNDSKEKAMDYINRNKSSLIYLLDMDDRTSEKYRIISFPSNFLIQKNGLKTVKVWEGDIEMKTIEEYLEKLPYKK